MIKVGQIVKLKKFTKKGFLIVFEAVVYFLVRLNFIKTYIQIFKTVNIPNKTYKCPH